MSLRILQKTQKNLDFSKTCVKISYVIHPKASIHTKRRCGNIEQSAASTKRNSQISINFHRANLSEISSTCIGTVRHTRHKFLGFFVFFKDPYWCAHFRRSFFVIPTGRSISGAIFCQILSWGLQFVSLGTCGLQFDDGHFHEFRFTVSSPSISLLARTRLFFFKNHFLTFWIFY